MIRSATVKVVSRYRESKLGAAAITAAVLIVAFSALNPNHANAQDSSTTCMDMGGGMVHCNTMDMSGSEQSDTQGQTELGRALGKLIFGDKEKRFKKKIGAMLAEGDCNGAAKYAYSEGRLELGNQIAGSCIPPGQRSSTPVPPAIDPNNLEASLQSAAASANAKTPMPLDEITEITKVEAIGTQLLFTAVIDATGVAVTEEDRSRIASMICADSMSPSILGAGASVRFLYVEKSGREIGAVMVTRQTCGF